MSEKRKIFIVYLVSEIEPELSFSGKQCDVGFDLRIVVGFKRINWEDIDEKVTELSDILKVQKDVCDGILFYASPTDNYDVSRLLDMLVSLEKNLINTRVYLDLKVVVGNFPLSRLDILEDFGIDNNEIPKIRIINAFPYPMDKNEDEDDDDIRLLEGLYEDRRFTIEKNKKVYDCIVQTHVQTNELTCKTWFEWYLKRAFTCLSGRLLQKSGTCFLNTILNGIILSDLGSYLLSTILPILHPDYKKKFATPLDRCITKHLKDDLNFIFHSLYQTRCFKQSFSRKEDFLGKYAKHRNPNYVNGGWPLLTFAEIIDNINEAIEKNINRNDLLTLSPAWVPYDTTIKHLAFNLKDDNPPPENYYPIFTSLVFYKGKERGHAVCGFLCDGQKAIFDSNGYFEFLDWEDINDLELYADIISIYTDEEFHFNPEKSHIFYMKKGLNLNYSICN